MTPQLLRNPGVGGMPCVPMAWTIAAGARIVLAREPAAVLDPRGLRAVLGRLAPPVGGAA
jgi:ABC-type phosphate/phosphonate transport system ATPase subunit